MPTAYIGKYQIKLLFIDITFKFLKSKQLQKKRICYLHIGITYKFKKINKDQQDQTQIEKLNFDIRKEVFEVRFIRSSFYLFTLTYEIQYLSKKF